MSKGWASAGLTVRSNLSPERGAKPVTSFVKNLSALSDWYSVYTSAIAFTVSVPHRVGACAPHGVGAVLPDGRGVCSQWGGGCAPRRVGGVLPDGWGLCSPWGWGACTPPQGFPGDPPAVAGSSVGSSGLERCPWGQPGLARGAPDVPKRPHGSVLGEGSWAELVAGFPVGWGGSLAGHLPAPRLPLPHPQVYMNAVWHGWAIPMFLFLAILRLSLNYLIAR